MIKLTLLLISVSCGSIFVKAQTPTTNSTPVQINSPNPIFPQPQQNWENQLPNTLAPRVPKSWGVIPQKDDDYGKTFKPLLLPRKEVYRKSTNEEKTAVQPEQADFDKFAEFLRQPQTGLLRLMNDIGCNSSTFFNLSPDCQKYSMPGGGASYSFRLSDYRVLELSDLNFRNEEFSSPGVRTQGIFAVIGDIPLEKVTLQTLGLQFLVEYKPETNSKKQLQKKAEFTKGIESDGFTYRNSWKVFENTTYVLRSISYGKRIFSQTNYEGDDFDKKRDIIVVFRVVRRSDDDSITILWKKLAEKEAPKI